ncbi:MAG: DUF4407 domain-containing protein, partial [Chitinophagaceae bacterium]
AFWIKAGCFITGYNYSVLKNCSEVAKKTLKKYTAAMIIMCLLWGLIGFSFADRYMHSSIWTSIASALLFILVVIQIERQIIMQTVRNNAMQIFRGVIAIMMALIGSLIIDQIIFKDDIELQKEQFINDKVEKIYPARAAISQKQLDDLKAQLAAKNVERTKVLDDIHDNPFVTVKNTSNNPVPLRTVKDSLTGESRIIYGRIPGDETRQVPNPNSDLLPALDSTINSLQRLQLAQGDTLAHLRTSIQKKLEEKTGFLDELGIMAGLLSNNIPAMIVYIVWFLLLLGLECLILMNKRHEQPTDYDAMIKHQMDTHLKKLSLLSGNAGG